MLTDLYSAAEAVLPRRGDRPRIMGVLNATPDSFAGDGLGESAALLVERGLAQVAAGADILDVGGESTRPGAVPVTLDEELRRVIPVVEGLANAGVPLSIDTVKPEVADAALAAGAVIVNDVSALRDERIAQVAARNGAWLILMHNRWEAEPSRDHLGGYYRQEAAGDPVEEVAAVLMALGRQAVEAGVARDRIYLDPGLGFGKSPRESLELLKRLAELRERLAPYPLLVGPSRKSFVGRALDLPVEDRLEGTLACVALAAYQGAEIIRVHDVLPCSRAARMAWAVRQGRHAEVSAG